MDRSKIGETKARPRGLNEPVRNRSLISQGKATTKARPQKKRKRLRIASATVITSNWESLQTLHTEKTSLMTRYNNALWLYCESSTGFTQGDVIKFAGDPEPYKIIDFVVSAKADVDCSFVIEPVKLVGTGNTAYHKTVRRRRKRVPMDKFIKYQPTMHNMTMLAKPSLKT